MTKLVICKNRAKSYVLLTIDEIDDYVTREQYVEFIDSFDFDKFVYKNKINQCYIKFIVITTTNGNKHIIIDKEYLHYYYDNEGFPLKDIQSINCKVSDGVMKLINKTEITNKIDIKELCYDVLNNIVCSNCGCVDNFSIVMEDGLIKSIECNNCTESYKYNYPSSCSCVTVKDDLQWSYTH